MIRICLCGLGKTGSEIARTVLEQENFKLVSAICGPDSIKRGCDTGEVIGCAKTGITVEGSDNIEEIVFRTKPDVVLDFTCPDATIRNAAVFSRMKVNIVIGTTGFSRLGLKKLFVLTRRFNNGIVYAPNITFGVNVMMLLSSLAASILHNYDFQVT